MTNEEIMILGKLSGQMEAVLDKQVEQTTNIGKLFERLDKMPCGEHGAKIIELCKWKNDSEGADQSVRVEKAKGTISLKNAIIVGILLIVSTAAIETIVKLILTGKP